MVWEHFLDSNVLFGSQIENFETLLNPQTHSWRKTCRAKNYKIQMKIEIVQIQYWNDFFDTKTKCTFSLLKWLVWNILIIVVISTLFYNREYYIVPKISCPYNWSWINEFDHDLSANKSLKLIPTYTTSQTVTLSPFSFL